MEEEPAVYELMVQERLLCIHHGLSNPDEDPTGVLMSNVNSHIDVDDNVRDDDVKSKNPQADAQVNAVANMDLYMKQVGSKELMAA